MWFGIGDGSGRSSACNEIGGRDGDIRACRVVDSVLVLTRTIVHAGVVHGVGVQQGYFSFLPGLQ
jgi:hypothetical protein